MLAMYCKQYLLLGILFVLVILSAYADKIQQKDSTASDSKKPTASEETDEDNDYDDDGEVDDTHAGSKSSSHGLYSPYFYRPHPRWPQAEAPMSIDELKHQQLWAQYLQAKTPQVPQTTPVSPNSNPTFTNGPTCNALIDPQYSIFSDMCGALPQARYSLPNSFGHYDRWQIAHILTTIMGSTTDQVCIRSLRHLLCPMLFQPCRVRHEPPLVLPCQYYCRAVKAQCSMPALDVIPCEVLPYASDLCPNIQPSSTFMPAGPISPPVQSPPSDGVPLARSNIPVAPKQGPSQTVTNTPAQTPVQAPPTGPVNPPQPPSFVNDYRQPSKFPPLTMPFVKTNPTQQVYPPVNPYYTPGAYQPAPKA